MKNFTEFLKERNTTDTIREEYISEQYDILLEKLITVGGRAYPKFGNVVIMAGGAGSGKGFIKDKLLGLEGAIFDVDALKTLAAKVPVIRKKIKDEMGLDLEMISQNLKDPNNVAQLHQIIGDYLDIPNKKQKAFFTSVLSADMERKPNIIFDVTLKDLYKLENITRRVSMFGYDTKNIHIVWVVNDIEVAKAQNQNRDRVVPTEILINTHRGASSTMADIVNMGDKIKKYMDGDIVFAFNKVKVDSDLVKSKTGGAYIKDAAYFYVKRKGKPPTSIELMDKEIRNKIR